MDSWPAVNKAYSMISQVERKSNITANHSFLDQVEGSSAMFVRPAVEVNKFKKWDDKKTFLKCDHCGIKGHVKKNCYRLKGYPDWSNTRNLRPRSQNNRNLVYANVVNAHYMGETLVDFTEGASNSNKTTDESCVHCGCFAEGDG
ncbi:hypothetical protein LIER_33961 [Lithospermum erythrorhizon]|uniref:CCHC-type domain-containing protein n=1 Tax=Lithospermum erythrorhizon TaxID=34254 RepID=A0AAV3RY48_LITER